MGSKYTKWYTEEFERNATGETYAAGRRTLVRLAHTPDWTEVEVTTAGTAGTASASAALLDGGPHVSDGRA